MSQKLYDLIQTLSKNEKGYFKKFASIYSNTDSIYHKLFDEIEKQNIFDEAKIKLDLFSKYKDTNYYNVVKNYLYNIILKSLRSFHSQKKVMYKVNALLTNIELLYQKKLISQCVAELKKAKKLITQFELFERSIEILIWERRLLALKGFSPKFDKLELNINKKSQESILKIKNLETYMSFQYKLYSIAIQMGTRNNEKDIKSISEIINNKYLTDKSSSLSKRAEIIMYNTKTKYYEVIGNKQEFFKYSEKFITTLEENQFLVTENVENLVNGTYNLLIASASLKDKEKFYHYFKKFNNIPKKYSRHCSKELNNLVSFYALNVLLFFLICVEDFEAAYELNTEKLPLSEKEMKGVFKLIYIELLYFTSYISFALDKHSEAQDWLSRILDFPSSIFRKDILTYAKLLDLLNHYDLGNFKLVENLLETTASSLSKLKRKMEYDKQLIKMLSKLLKAESETKKMLVFEAYKEIFLEIRKDKTEDTAFEHINIIRWIDKKTAQILKRPSS